MLIDVIGEYEDVIEIDSDFAEYDKVLKNVIHERREYAGRICQSEEHDIRFEQPSIGHKGSLPFIASLNLYIVVPPAYAKLGEVLGLLESIHQFRHQQQWVPVLNGDVIQSPIVLDWT